MTAQMGKLTLVWKSTSGLWYFHSPTLHLRDTERLQSGKEELTAEETLVTGSGSQAAAVVKGTGFPRLHAGIDESTWTERKGEDVMNLTSQLWKIFLLSF